MDWQDRGIILSARPHGESSVIADIFTRRHGRHSGLIKGGRSRRQRPVLQPGNGVEALWRARLEDHLGLYTLELTRPRAGHLMEDGFALAGLTSACAMAAALPERQAHEALFDAFEVLLDHLDQAALWPILYVRWELGVLQELGFGLDLSRCAVTGAQDDLAFVSPKSGRAVSAAGAGTYKPQLLPLPGFLIGAPAATAGAEDVLAGLRLTGHFLEKYLFQPVGQALPEPRARLLEKIVRGMAG